MSLRKLYYLLPPAARILARKIVFMPTDLISKMSANEKLMPPKGMIYTGGGDFIETGKRFLGYFKDYGNLSPDDNVLDIGSGIGRLAIPLATYLNADACYNGFDVITQGVNWCDKNISTKYSHFKFHHIDLKNDLYRNDGSEAKEYEFPLKNGSQDFIFLISVFTHLVPEEMKQYISEISRLLAPGKTCFATFFILDKDKPQVNLKFSFKHNYGHYALMDDKVTSANVAFEKGYLLDVFRKNGLTVEHYLPGHWRNPSENNDALDFQDIVVLRKGLNILQY